jgi:ClpP class serine protease
MESTSPLDEPVLTRVDISGPIESKAGFHGECGGWSDGHDAIAERLCAALELGDVLLVVDSPGGAHAGLQQGVNHVLEYKARYGRRVTGWADEMIGSAAYWWTACVCDEIYGPEAMIVGSIGARAAHQSIAGHLAQEGIAVTYFASTPGKVAFAPELPLSKLGKARGDRDIQIAFRAFAEAVSTYRGLDYEYIVDLDADALPGQMAADAGLVDGVATFFDVLQYTQALAERKDKNV